MKMTVMIEWEHGDADAKTNQSYVMADMDQLNRFLSFIFDVKRFGLERDYYGHLRFTGGYYSRTEEHISKVNEKYGNEFEGFIPYDMFSRCNDHYPDVNRIWLKFGNVVKRIVWGNVLGLSELVDAPKIGDVVECGIGHIRPLPYKPFGVVPNRLDYFKLVSDGMDKDASINAVLRDIVLEPVCTEYKFDYYTMTYIYVYEYEGLIFYITHNGYVKDIPLPESDYFVFTDYKG